MVVPRFNYELPPPRKDRHVLSVVLHVVVIALALKYLPMLPGPRIVHPRTTINVLFSRPVPQAAPAPVVKILPPAPKILAKLVQPKVVPPAPEPKPEPPRIETQPRLNLPNMAVARPKLEQKIVTGTFTTPEAPKPVAPNKEVAQTTFSGSSQPATLNKPPRDVQTGGFGDPNGIRGTSDKKPVIQVAAVGSFNLPAAPGSGNGTGGSHGSTGTVASSGFGDVAGGGKSDRTRRSGTVAPAGFNQPGPAKGVTMVRVSADDNSKTKPVEILYKPKPAYTPEARQLRVEGEVLVEVNFAASGQLQVQRVVRGLGHGLDESALHAAQQIRFRPAQRDGAPYDSTALVHIVFALAE